MKLFWGMKEYVVFYGGVYKVKLVIEIYWYLKVFLMFNVEDMGCRIIVN